MGAQAIKARFREKLRKRILWIPTRKLDFSAFRNSYSISTYRTPLRRILGGTARLGGLIRRAACNHFPLSFSAWGYGYASTARCTLTPRYQPSLAQQSSARGNFLSVLYWTVHSTCQTSRCPISV